MTMILCSSFAQAQITTDTKLEFTYDASGNQILRDIHKESSNPEADPIFVGEEQPINDISISIEEKFSVFPNPTAGKVTLSWYADVAKQVTKIELISMVTSQSQTIIRDTLTSVVVDLTLKPSGLYLIVFHLRNPQTPKIQKKIVKR